MPDTSTPAVPRKIDAVLVPIAYRRGNAKGDQLMAMRDEFRPILGNPPTVWFGRNGEHWLGHAAQFESLYFPKDSERTGQPRFTWTDRGDGVMHGVKVEGADDAL